MSGHTTFGFLAYSVILTGVLKVAGLVTEPEAGIQVHGLSFVEQGGHPYVFQSRTVTANGALTAHWSATVSVLNGTKPETICSGDGYWDYASGDLSIELLFDEWVGDAGCFDSIPDGAAYILAAEYRWGDTGIERHRTAPIVKITEVTE